MVQALPCSKEEINASPTLQTDVTPGIIVASYPVGYLSFDGSTADGPVPTLFSNDPEATLKRLRDTPEFAFECLQALVSRLYAREELTR